MLAGESVIGKQRLIMRYAIKVPYLISYLRGRTRCSA